MVLVGCAAILMVLGQSIYRGLPQAIVNPSRAPVEQAMAAVDREAPPTQVYTLVNGSPWLATLFYANRILPEKNAGEIVQVITDNPQKNLWLLVIESIRDGKKQEYVPQEGVAEDLSIIESRTGRKRIQMAAWEDEGRRTVMWKFPANTPTATKP